MVIGEDEYMANTFDLTYTFTGEKAEKAYKKLLSELKVPKVYVQRNEDSSITIKFEDRSCSIKRAEKIATLYNCDFIYIAEEPGCNIYWTNDCYYPTYKLEGDMLKETKYFEAEGEVLDYLYGNFSFNKKITNLMKRLDKILRGEMEEYNEEFHIEDVVKEIQNQHKENPFYVAVHQFVYVAPKDTE